MSRENITIKDIARELGISPSTVSRALKDHPDISQATRDAVNELAERWNYRPNPIALSLKSGSSKTIGVIIPDVVHYFFSTVISGIEDVVYRRDYNMILCQSNEMWEHEVKNIKTLLSSRVDGILASVAKTTTDFRHYRSITEKDIPLVFFDRAAEEIDTDSVVIDDETGSYKAVIHLLRTGKKRIVHLAGPPRLAIARNRLNGYLKAMKEYRLTPQDEDIVKCDDIQSAERIIPALLTRTPRPDAFFAVNDLTAAQTLMIVKRHGLRIPEDISVVGFTNSQIATLTDPGLTSVDQKGFEMGQLAARLLIDRIENRRGPVQKKIITSELVIRGSSSTR
ncbi:MAG: LacI family DNA-binding transcriptional regulator [Bacteroidales bacterium]|jgi:LacI family transcriptional regulator|nr:LacI family DNA-binding transcriptional regulator [Bacteroidales bacterium]MDX9925862.1 LacI family DNA-binding transcriptional regulator [Bacteroidales bacterium]HNX85127.1 LacI family DNA-binding transcriptional regulator [Bacteroidales bacterium]HOC48106.1 LacI family DNA-binding transcriptional regulator [Bacteroidales bacterium]HPS97941.1 LacI family DNA-binding transcriptional regulator [Bacteroidales bacterium]